MTELFDMKLRAQRRDRAARIGPELFLYERAFEDCLDRLSLIQRHFERILLVGCPEPGWPGRLRELGAEVETADPGAIFAQRAGGLQIVEDDWTTPEARFDLVLAIGTLDTVNQLPLALLAIRHALRPDGLLLGAIPGGDTLPQLRKAMRAADQALGSATAHVHPRVEASALAGLLSAAGFSMPVVDVDRAQVAYPSMAGLVRDLRAMGMTNVLSARSLRPLSRSAQAAAFETFAATQEDGRTTEVFEILHFAAWAPAVGTSTDQG